ncbi:MAG: gliding motility-associated ABC transporter ATP-binding subunit GldA [Bacteroidales bacterium]|nr:gliding motility-associated ABC transporter ATP-binding subunit GldA [Bacteroidales bacterium]
MNVIEIKEVSKFYGSEKALDKVSLSVNKGEVVGLLGPNGAGKSTLMKLLTSYLPPDEGSLRVKGIDVQQDSLFTRRMIGYLPEHNPLYQEMYVKEYLSYVLGIYNLNQKISDRVDEIVEMTGLRDVRYKKIMQLSKGYRQRVGIAQALIHDPDILILDEPTTGLDPNQLVGIRNLISSLGETKTVLLSTHIMQEVEAVCGRVVIINKGKIIADKNKKELTAAMNNQNEFRLELKENISASVLEGIPFVQEVFSVSDNIWTITTEEGNDVRERIFQYLVSKNLNILSFSRSEQNLEQIFRKLTSD